MKNNPKNLDLNEVSNVADRILRYEITSRKGLLNYIFRQYVKDDINTVFNHHYSMIQKSRVKKARSLSANLKTPIYVGTSAKIDTFIHKTINNKSFNFHLASRWEDLTENSINLIDENRLSFNIELFRGLYDFFDKRLKKYQLGVKLGIKDIYGKIQEKKNEADLKENWYGKKQKLDQASQLLLLATLSQFTDISDLKGILPKATYYRYVKKLENLGIPKHSPDIAVHPPPLDYQQYLFYFGKYHTVKANLVGR